MATDNKDFKVKNGLIVGDSTNLVNYTASVTRPSNPFIGQIWVDSEIDVPTSGTSYNVPSTMVARDEQGTFDISAIDFDTASAQPSAVARLTWDDGEGSLTYGAKGGNVNISIGQENVALCYNGSASAMSDGDVVRIIGVQGQRPKIDFAVNTYDATSSKTFGVVTEPIASGEEGFVTTFGIVNNVNTSDFTAGASLWLSASPGKLTEDITQSPEHLVFVGYCLKSAPSSGRIFINPQNGYELEELHNIALTSLQDNEILQWNSSASLWQNSNLITAITELDGAGSGLDADTLDGNHGSYFAPVASPTFYGTVTSTYQKFTPTATQPSWSEGNLYYDSEEKTLVLQGSGTTFEISVGQREWVRCRNSSGAAIPKGSIVYVTGVHIPGDPVHGHHPTIALADASDVTKINVLGMTGETINDGAHGYVVVRGYVDGINTESLTSGTRVHLSASAPGGLSDNAPGYPYYPVDLGICLTSASVNGVVYLDIAQHVFESLRVTENGYIDGNLTVAGDLSILGSESIVNLTNLSVSDNFVYLNSGDTIGDANTTASAVGLDDATFTGHYSGSVTLTYKARIIDVGNGPSGEDAFEWSIDDFSTSASSYISVSPTSLIYGIKIDFIATTGHTINDLWYGEASPVNVDFGWIGNRNTGTTGVGYTHSGIFFDVDDEKFKAFSSYSPEPEGSVNTGDASFTLGTLVVAEIEGDLTGNVTGNLLGNVTGNVSGNAGTVTNGVYTTGTYSDPSWITDLAWSKITSTPTTLSGYNISDAQPLDGDLTAIASLSASGYLKRTGTDTWELTSATDIVDSSQSFKNLEIAIHMGVY